MTTSKFTKEEIIYQIWKNAKDMEKAGKLPPWWPIIILDIIEDIRYEIQGYPKSLSHTPAQTSMYGPARVWTKI